jgi:hypothetical protein
MARKIRKDITIGGLERKLNLAPGTITNSDGRDARSDKKLETLQKESAKVTKSKRIKKKPLAEVATSRKKTTAVKGKAKMAAPAFTKRPKVNSALVVTQDQKAAAKRTVKSHPKSVALVKQLRAAMAAKTKK